MNLWYVNSILGPIRLAEENEALCAVEFCPEGVPELEPLPRKVVQTPLLQEAEEQLNEYFAGVRREFDLPLAPKGTPFQQAVWQQLLRIPYGEVRTYGQLAAALGKPGASRAVGSACHRNPLSPGGGGRRLPYRLRRRAGHQGIPAGAGKAGVNQKDDCTGAQSSLFYR